MKFIIYWSKNQTYYKKQTIFIILKNHKILWSFLIHNKLLTIKTNKMKKIILVYIMAFFVNYTQAQENKFAANRADNAVTLITENMQLRF